MIDRERERERLNYQYFLDIGQIMEKNHHRFNLIFAPVFDEKRTKHEQSICSPIKANIGERKAYFCIHFSTHDLFFQLLSVQKP